MLTEVTLSAEIGLGMIRDFFKQPTPKGDTRNRLSRAASWSGMRRLFRHLPAKMTKLSALTCQGRKFQESLLGSGSIPHIGNCSANA
jgi:hypothetical protein